MKKIITTIIVFMLFTTIAWAQSGSAPSLPQLTTPSPKASMMDRFGLYPTNLYTGLVDITVPIHTIKVKGITIPIEFKYHASGLKYDDLPMEVGYGWTLIAGGTVSYSARGVGITHPNGENKGTFIKKVSDIVKNDKFSPWAPDSDQKQLDYVINGAKDRYQSVDAFRDSEYDQYNFTFPGHSGRYYELYDGYNFTIPSSVHFSGGGSNPIAIDEYGNKYEFGVKDWDDCERNYTHYLTKIITANKADTVSFTYQQFSPGSPDKQVKRPIIDNTYIIAETSNNGSSSISTSRGGVSGISYKAFNTPILTEIKYNGGYVSFQYSTASIRSLVKILIRDNGSGVNQTIILDKTDNKYLNAVRFQDMGNKDVYSYRFEYDGTKPEGYIPVDYWGYCKGPAASSPYAIYTPNFQVAPESFGSQYNIPGMDRTPNETYMKKGSLIKVVYPTKGYSVFTYEGNRSGGQLYGGLRIKEIKSYNENNILLENKWYKYGMSESGNGRAVRQINSHDYLTAFYAIQSIGGGSESFGEMPGTKTMSKVYGAFPRCSYFEQGSPVVYPYVTEYTGSPTGMNGKTVYQYTDFTDYWYDKSLRNYTTEFPKWSYSWKNGKLSIKYIYDSKGNIVYILNNKYEEINREDFLNLRVLPYISISSSAVEESFSSYPSFNSVLGGSLYDYYNYYITRGEYALTESIETVDKVSKVTQYKYNELGQLTEQTLIDTDRNRLSTRYKYPYDFQNTTSAGSVYQAMYQKNILAPVIETAEYKNDILLSKIINEYKVWNSNLIALELVKQQTYYLEYRIRYSNYDSYGNPCRIAKDDVESVSYLWSYKGQRLIAEIKNGAFPLSQELMNRVTKASYPSSADMAAIESMRSNASLIDSQVTTFHYDGFGRLSQTIAPNGTGTYFEYDDFGRLVRTKDHDKNIKEVYQYDYKQ